MLDIQQLVKTYENGHQAVKGVDLAIHQGEFIVLVGPSGCGKSSILRSIAGLEAITSGEIHLAGRRVDNEKPANRDIAMVFQNYALYPHMSVYDNLAYGLKNRGVSKATIAEKLPKSPKRSRLKSISIVSPPNSQVANVSVWRWDERLFAIRNCSYLTSPSPTSTQPCVLTCGWKSKNCSESLASLASTSPMIRWRQ